MNKNIRFLSIVLALCFVLGVTSVSCTFAENNTEDPKVVSKNIDPDTTDIPSITNNAATFNSDEELLEFIEENCEEMFFLYDSVDVEEKAVADSSNGLNAPAAGFDSPTDDYSLDEEIFVTPETAPKEEVEVSGTNLVDENVDEGDILKTDGEYIYILRNNEIIIVSAKEKDSEVLSYYKIFADGEGDVSEMYIKGDKAVIVGNLWRYETDDFSENTNFGKPVDSNGDNFSDFSLSHRKGYTLYSAVYVIDISDREKPVEESYTLVEGDLLTSREIDGKIYLVANKNFSLYHDVTPDIGDILPYVYDENHGVQPISSTKVFRPVVKDVTSSIMTIAVVDYKNGTQTDIMSVLGSGSDIYMTAESLYIFGYAYENTSVAKYSVKNGVEYVASVVVPGYTATDFSYNEYNGKFRIATTSYGKIGTVNNVYVYNETLEKIGELTGLAPEEKIYSVRFSGDVAYMVTFRQVDPLFVIDMSENDPKVLGELKIPGFSTYLHPVGDGLLLGIGRETKDDVYKDYYGKEYVSTYTVGIKISLFDVNDPTNPKEIDVLGMVGGEYANADALNNHKAFVYSDIKNTGYFAIDSNEGNGFVCVEIQDGKLSGNIVVPENSGYYGYNSYNSRVCFVGDTLYFYQYNRITVYDRNTLEEIHTVTVK